MNLREELELPLHFSGNWIPKEFYYLDGINGSDREMLAMIKNLNNGHGCTASNEYLAKILNVSDRQIRNILSKLESMNLIRKELVNKTDRTLYLSNELLSPIQLQVEKIEGRKKTSRGAEENFQGGRKETSTNNKDNNKSINKEEKETLNTIISSYTDNLELVEALKDFLKMRKAAKKPMTNRALKLLLKNLDIMGKEDTDIKIYMLEQSIMNNWLSVYKPKDYIPKTVKSDKPKVKFVLDEEYLKKLEMGEI